MESFACLTNLLTLFFPAISILFFTSGGRGFGEGGSGGGGGEIDARHAWWWYVVVCVFCVLWSNLGGVKGGVTSS